MPTPPLVHLQLKLVDVLDAAVLERVVEDEVELEAYAEDDAEFALFDVVDTLADVFVDEETPTLIVRPALRLKPALLDV